MNIQGKTALVVVDFQGGPLDREPTEQDPWDHRAHRDRVKTLVDACRQKRIPVIWIQEVHKPHLQDIGRELDGSEGPHCIEGNPYTELADGLVPLSDEYHIKKRRYSAFFGTELELVLKSYKAESLLLVGGFTDICVRYTAVDAHQHDYFINVLTDCVSGSSLSAHNDALESIEYLQRKALVTFDETMEWLDTVDVVGA